MPRAVWLTVGALAATYYLTTLSIWFAHWLWHVDLGPHRGLHARGHHRVYPSASSARSAAPIRTPLKYNGLFALIPCLAVQGLAQYLVLPRPLGILSLLQMLAIVAAINCAHTQCHLRVSPLERFRWFAQARQAHDIHHEADANYMVGDHFWDRLFGTYGAAPPAPVSDPRRGSRGSVG